MRRLARDVSKLVLISLVLTLTSFAVPPAGEVATDGHLSGGPSVDPAPPTLAFVEQGPWIDTSDREAVLALHESWSAIEPAPMAWTGNHESCDAGRSSEELRQQTIDRVNFYRAMAGVPAVVVDEPVYSAKAQHGALTMSAQGELSHNPSADFACLNDFGYEAAANSNLYLGRSGANAIDGYIEDPGEGNIDVGHRLTVLHPPTTKMGVGHTAETDAALESNVLWVFDSDVFAGWGEIREQESFVAWPARGYVPAEIVYPRWSFSMASADFSGAEVSLEVDGSEIPVEVVARNSVSEQVPPPVIVWEPELNIETGQDTEVTVTITGVQTADGEQTYRYVTTIIG